MPLNSSLMLSCRRAASRRNLPSECQEPPVVPGTARPQLLMAAPTAGWRPRRAGSQRQSRPRGSRPAGEHGGSPHRCHPALPQPHRLPGPAEHKPQTPTHGTPAHPRGEETTPSPTTAGRLGARPEKAQVGKARWAAEGVWAGGGVGSTLGGRRMGCPWGGREPGLGGRPRTAQHPSRAEPPEGIRVTRAALRRVRRNRSPRSGCRCFGFGRGPAAPAAARCRAELCAEPPTARRQRCLEPCRRGETAVSDSKHRRRAERQSGL